ncbi:hypothetical protein BJ741DRAFT_601572 [Chytriomyces cf. hyalinus JEL632]|nr:hypothetical protein BJ741DRAFT_601572 [Chytriomyces cf. hyalinus JEL632]
MRAKEPTPKPSFGLGVGVGIGLAAIGVGLFGYFQTQQNSLHPVAVSSFLPQINPQLAGPPSTIVSNGGVAVADDPLTRARSIVRHGFHGPKADNLYRLAYSAAYDRGRRNAHWVAERLTKESLEKLLIEDDSDTNKPDRKHSKFTEDPTVPPEFRVKPIDYSNSGYDRGHLAPAADVTESQKAIDETFYMSNMSPQVPAFNRGIWASFERYVRGLVRSFDEVYVVTGPLYLPKVDEGDGKFYVRYEVIGREKNVAVPTHFYKVILGVKNGKNYLGSFVLPNEGASHDSPLESFMLPVSAIERSTGLEFFPMLERKSLGSLCSVVKCGFLLAAKFKLKQGNGEDEG